MTCFHRADLLLLQTGRRNAIEPELPDRPYLPQRGCHLRAKPESKCLVESRSGSPLLGVASTLALGFRDVVTLVSLYPDKQVGVERELNS